MTHRVVPLLAFVLLGCAGLDGGLPSNRCASDTECTNGHCDVALGMCIADAPETVTIGLEVHPVTEPYGGTVQPVGFEPFEVGAAVERNLQLETGVLVTGAVLDADRNPIPAGLTLVRQSVVPGAPATTISIESSGTDPPDVNSAGEPIGFTAQLLPERRHDIRVTPTGDAAAQLPPLELAYASPPGGMGRIEIQYPPMCDDPATDESPCLWMFEGRVVTGSPETGRAGAVVTLVDRLTGRRLSSRYVTGTDPEADPGYFRVYFPVGLWREPDTWFLRVSAATSLVTEVGPTPTFTRTAEALTTGADGMIRVLAPDTDDLRITYSGTVEDQDGNPLVDATLRFTSSDVTDPETNIIGSYTATAATDEDGRFSLELLGHPDAPATYDVVITPSQVEDHLGVRRTERRLGSDASGQLFTVPPRARFGGTVQTVMGDRMIDARVVAQARGTDDGGDLDPVAFLARSSQTTTDTMGLFDLRLDVGVYDLVIEPPAGTNFPWRIERDVAIGGAEAPITSVYELSHPVPITGVATWLVEGEQQPVVDGEVRAYAILESAEGTRTVLVGRATTDATGAYTLLLPPSI